MNTQVTPKERSALLSLVTGPSLVVTVRADLYHDGMLKQNDRGKPRDLWWKRHDTATNRIHLAFGPGR